MKIYKVKDECRVHSNIKTYKHYFGGNKCFLQKLGFKSSSVEKNGNSKMNSKKKAEQQCQNTWQLSGSALSSVQLQALGGLHYSSVLKEKLFINISDYSDYQIIG